MEKRPSEYNAWHNTQKIDLELNTPWHEFIISQLQNINLQGKKILEIGCGRGGFACWLASKYAKVYTEFVAADFSKSAVDIGKSYALDANIDGINWSIKDIMQIDLPSDYFDIVISCETIEHVPDPFKAINELHRVTKKGGVVLLTTPNYGNFYGLFRIYLRLAGRKWTEVGQPINKFVIFAKTKYWLRKVGYRIVYAASKNISYPSPFRGKDVSLNWSYPKWLTKQLGINSFFKGYKF